MHSSCQSFPQPCKPIVTGWIFPNINNRSKDLIFKDGEVLILVITIEVPCSASNGFGRKIIASLTCKVGFVIDITGAVSSAITNAKAGIVNGWTNIKNGVKGVWDSVLGVIKSPIESAKTWLQEKVNYFKGLFNFQWKLPSFKLPKINVTWNDIGWGIKLPKLSVSWNALGGIFDRPTILGSAAGLQGVGEAGAEAILPLDTLWTEMSARLKAGMIDVMSGFMGEHSTENMESLLRDLIDAVQGNNTEPETVPAVNVENMVMANDMDAQSLAAQISAMTRRRQHGYGY